MFPPPLSRRGVIGGAGLIAASLPREASAIDLKDFGARPGQDIAASLAKAMQASGGAPITLGPGEYRLNMPFTYLNRDLLKTSSRGPGLVLIGSGSNRTVIECTHSGEAGLEVGQEYPYRFTVGGRLEGFSLRGNPKALRQDGLRLSGALNYTIADVEVIGFTGNGLSLPWREDLRWDLDGVEIISGSKLARRQIKEGFTDGTGLSGSLRIFGSGIPAGTTIARLIDDKNLEMSEPATETGTRTLQFVGNSDAFQSIVDITACRLTANGGWGLWGGAGIGAVVAWTRTEAALNKAGGVFCGGNAWSLDGGAIYSNDGYGLVVDRVNGGPLMFRAERIEFDSNVGAHVWLKEISTASFDRCRFITHYYPDERRNKPEIGLIIGNTPATRLTRGVEIKDCQFRAAGNDTADYSALRFGAPGSYRHVDILDPAWIARAPHNQLFDNIPEAEANVFVREDGITSYAGRTPRAWAILEQGAPQKISPGRPTQLNLDQSQGAFADRGVFVVPYGQLYDVEGTISVEGATPGSAIDLAITIDNRVVRRSTVAAAALKRQTFFVRALLPLAARARVGLRLGHDGVGDLTIIGGPEGGSFSLIAAI